MSTRSTTHFTFDGALEPTAIIYRHSDECPDGAGMDIMRFLDECAKLKDNRFGEPSYLAAKYVVFLADIFNWDYHCDHSEPKRPPSRLDFISVGVVMKDPLDIEYRYVITCHDRGSRPTIKFFHIKERRPLEEVPIPVETV
jgi:hypothetical protein